MLRRVAYACVVENTYNQEASHIMQIDENNLTARLSLAAEHVVSRHPKLDAVPLAVWREAASVGELPEVKDEHSPLALAIHSFAVELIIRRLGKRPSRRLVQAQQRLFSAAHQHVCAAA
ncbi:hypothetical protein HY971_03070 [Candidatus Kaiserbacteria bacterium]|nr:hypothetical protein [Candidatus Kaiserbacteria bacterium]